MHFSDFPVIIKARKHKKSENQFFEFLRVLKKLFFSLFEFSPLFYNLMFVKTYENLDSSALYRIKLGENVVFVTYNSNIDKEYEFSCQNCDIFGEKLSKTLKNKESLGKLLHKSIKEEELVPITK